MDNDLTGQLTDAMDGAPVPFFVDGEAFTIRQPSPEEYDDAMAIQSITRKRALALPEIAELQSVPCSDRERAIFEGMIEAAERLYEETEDDAAGTAIAERINRLREQMEKRTLAEEVASERAILARDRYLCQRLLADKNGKALLDPKSPTFAKKWAKLSLSVKDAARPAIWTALALVQNVPFSWDQLRD